MSLFSFLSSPVTLAAAAVIALGVIIYEVVNHQKEERVPNHGCGRRPSNPGSGSVKSESSNIISYDNLASDIRRRRRGETEVKTSMNNNVAKNDEKLSNGSKDSNPKSEFDEKNYCQKVYDNVKNINQTDDKEKTFHKNIDDCVLNSSTSSVSVNINEPKLMNTSHSVANKKGIHLKKQAAPSKRSKMENIANTREISSTNNDDPTYCSSSTVVSYQATSSEKKNIVNAPEISPANNDDTTYSGATSVNYKQNHTGSVDVKCMACEETLANAVAHPCKHCYMCIDCAIMVHRIYKKCTICESEIDHFEALQQ